ncbi:MAG: methionyl-tRNA formyltransferase [Candidatus Kerfeldbacteria bacterium CG_4_10_14_0_8_um_filter_42_10]|uniref:Methionyl-tRNA formyltransferase n=1 Tax=Candidatus Kerfeldbacteria bacterium CG_4_10_14_0_8_um_filter_42_10 TaxID=2014248 RepID=A0A2M7RK41_9BACT|nr:MAG: methionyl-tRNA formyltransferase [Candidatus Kerfeldbacteria bacterium CG_4_10_14_0_8_um_filter_42_10]
MTNKKYNAVFFGTPYFAVPVLESIIKLPYLDLKAVVTQPDKPAGRKQELAPPPVKTVALDNDVSVLQLEKIKGEEFEREFKKLNPDVAIIVAYGRIIPQNLLDIPQYGFLNIHASLLPKYRGASPIQYAILEGEKETGVTLMKIDQGLDTGPIISQKQIDIAPGDNFETLHNKLAKLGAVLLEESLPDYLGSKIPPASQNEFHATGTKIIEKEDGRIDWNKSAKRIERQIRAFAPWPGAYCWYNNKRLKIIEAALAESVINLEPGKVGSRDKSVLVGCGKGNLKLKIIQLEGKKPQPISEFIKGYPEFCKARLE